MKMSNSNICKMLMENDHLSEDDKQVLFRILGYEEAVYEKPKLSDRISDSVTNFIGSWSFIITTMCAILAWILLNAVILPTNMAFDSFPFILLNLVLGTIAAIQAPVIMMSQNRQDKRESLKTQNDYEIDLKTIVIIQDLHGRVVEICDKVDEIATKLDKHIEQSK